MHTTFRTVKSWGLSGPFNAKKFKFRVWTDQAGAFHLHLHPQGDPKVRGELSPKPKFKGAPEAFEKMAECCLDASDWYRTFYDWVPAAELLEDRNDILRQWSRVSSMPTQTTEEAFLAFTEASRGAFTAELMCQSAAAPFWTEEYVASCEKLAKKLLLKISKGNPQDIARVVASWVIAPAQKLESSPEVSAFLETSRQAAIEELARNSQQFLLKAYAGKDDAKSFMYELNKTLPFIELYKVGTKGLLKVPAAVLEFLREGHSEWLELDPNTSEATFEALEALYCPADFHQPYARLKTAYQAAKVL